MPDLFDPLALAGVTLPNRVVLSPMCQYSAVDGLPNDWHFQHLGRYAAAGLGLVIVEATHVSAEGRITPACLGLWNAAQEAAFARVVRFHKSVTEAPIGIQIAHSGRKGSANPPWLGGKPLAGEGAWPTMGPSAIPQAEGWPAPREMSEFDIARVTAEFVAAARRALAAGFDVLELHGAHGYLLHEFCSPVSNRRTDGYGGSLAGRMRLPLEVFDAVRALWPRDRPLGMRITGSDYVEQGGWTVADAIALATALKDRGADFVDVSGGGVSPDQKITLGPAYQTPNATAVREATGLVTFAVGLIATVEVARAIVREERADAVMMARALLHDPFWCWRAADQLGLDPPVPAPYRRGRRVSPEALA